MLIGYCGIACEFCKAYKSGECPGCEKIKECKIAECARAKKVVCLSCKEFPCKLFEEGFEWDLNKVPEFKELGLSKIKWKPFSKEFIMLFKLSKKKNN